MRKGYCCVDLFIFFSKLKKTGSCFRGNKRDPPSHYTPDLWNLLVEDGLAIGLMICKFKVPLKHPEAVPRISCWAVYF